MDEIKHHRAMNNLIAKLNIKQLISNATGQGVDVAVIDTGINATHPALINNVRTAYKVHRTESDSMSVQSLGELVENDKYNHGTGVAYCLTKIAPNAMLTDIKVLESYTTTGGHIIEALKFALDNDFKLINLSMTTQQEKWRQPLFELFERAYEQEAIVVCSQDNISPKFLPANLSSVIGVTRHDEDDIYKFIYERRSLIEVKALGTNIEVASYDGTYHLVTGTSYATPFVTGLIALMLEQNPDLTTYDVKSLLKNL